MVTCNERDKFLLTKLTKNIFKKVNFTHLKNLKGYITKSKPRNMFAIEFFFSMLIAEYIICFQLNDKRTGLFKVFDVYISVE